MDRSEIATIAHSIKKPSKSAAFGVLQEIIDSGASENALAELYAYFLPPMPETPKTLEQWVAEAVAGKGEVRHYLRHLYSDGRHLMASDGHRLHLVPTALAPGYYSTALTPVPETHRYPELDHVLTHTGPEYPLIPQWLPIRQVTTDGIHAYELPNGALLNVQYVDAATAGLESVTIRMKDDRERATDSVMFTRPDGGVAIVMPMRG